MFDLTKEISKRTKEREETPDRYRSIDDRSGCVGARLAKRIPDRTAPLFLSSQVPIYRSRWIDSAINKLNCIMDTSKRVRVLRSKSIIMYMRSSYRLVHLQSLKRETTYSFRHPSPPENFGRSRVNDCNTVSFTTSKLLH